jgi:hypothetical protein
MKMSLMRAVSIVPAALAIAALGCSSSATQPRAAVTAAPPARDDGSASKGGQGGDAHAAALEQLKTAPFVARLDRQDAVKVLLPDGERWMRVKFWAMQSLVGYRYGKDHHAIVAGFVTHVPDNTVTGACSRSIEEVAKPWLDAFDVAIKHDAPQAVMWNRQVVEVDLLTAKTATLVARDDFAVAFASYPAWKNACLTIGIAIPGRGEIERAREVRDRFAKEVFSKVEILSATEPAERY